MKPILFYKQAKFLKKILNNAKKKSMEENVFFLMDNILMIKVKIN
jgi:hypothetical protein